MERDLFGKNMPKPTGLNVHNGTYIVAHPQHGHFSIKLHTVQRGELAGKRILSLLVGPNNETNYEGVAFWDDGEKLAIIWRKHKGTQSRFPLDGYHWQNRGWSRVEQKLAIWCELVIRGDKKTRPIGFCTGENYELLLEGHCVRCNKKLTHPDSIRLGAGPTCRGKH